MCLYVVHATKNVHRENVADIDRIVDMVPMIPFADVVYVPCIAHVLYVAHDVHKWWTVEVVLMLNLLYSVACAVQCVPGVELT